MINSRYYFIQDSNQSWRSKLTENMECILDSMTSSRNSEDAKFCNLDYSEVI